MQDPALKSFELRDFFKSITLEEIQSLARAISEADREPELNATLAEAAAVMPLVSQINQYIGEREQAGDHELKRVAQGQFILLLAIFRLAEDRGYRWDTPHFSSWITHP